MKKDEWLFFFFLRSSIDNNKKIDEDIFYENKTNFLSFQIKFFLSNHYGQQNSTLAISLSKFFKIKLGNNQQSSGLRTTKWAWENMNLILYFIEYEKQFIHFKNYGFVQSDAVSMCFRILWTRPKRSWIGR